MTDSIKMGMIIRFPEDLVIDVDRGRVFQSLFPSHGWEIRGKSHNIHDVCAHIKRRHYFGSDFSVFSVGLDLGGNIIREDSGPINYVGIWYDINEGNPFNWKLSYIRIPKQPTHHTSSISMQTNERRYGVHTLIIVFVLVWIASALPYRLWLNLVFICELL